MLGLALDPHYAVYLEAGKIGCLLSYTARKDGVLVGYALLWLAMNPHHRTVPTASSDVLWLNPEARKPLVAWRFLKFIEDDLRARGIGMPQIGGRPGTVLCRLLEALGYEMIGVTYAKKF